MELKPGKYRHFKGNEYELLGIATHSETLEPMVIYRALYGEGGLGSGLHLCGRNISTKMGIPVLVSSMSVRKFGNYFFIYSYCVHRKTVD